MKGISRIVCLAVVLAIVSFSFVSAEMVYVDIKPLRCPNPFILESPGSLPVYIVGTATFDVKTVDPASVKLAGVAALNWGFEDITTPVTSTDPCACTTDPLDGYLDLGLRFSMAQMQIALESQYGELMDRQQLELPLTGMTLEGDPINGSDCIVIIKVNAVRVRPGVTK
jgi:hypothetical protein